MKNLTRLFLILVISNLTGCKTLTSETAIATKSLPGSAQSCCDEMSEFSFKKLKLGSSSRIEIKPSNPIFDFGSGNTLFQAIELPNSKIHIEIESTIANGGVVKPTVLLLNEAHKPTRIFDEVTFTYHPASLLRPDRLVGKFEIKHRGFSHPDNERYMVIYTSPQKISQHTQMLHPAKVAARARGSAEPALQDPVAAHSYTGSINVHLSGNNNLSAGALLKKNTKIMTLGKELSGPSEVNTSKEKPALPETEQYFIQAIDSSLSSGDIERALQLGEEARKAGAIKARKYFISRLKARAPKN